MTTRDRLMLVGMLTLAILAAGYIMVVSPERQKASKLSGEVQSARQQLQSAETQAAEASSARTRYATAYASLVSLGPAVPASGETPSLVYALASATHNRNVEFESITSGGSGSGASASAAKVSAASTTFSQEPFTFIFNGSFVDLYKLLDQLEGFTTQTTSRSLRVSGRLLTIDGVQLTGSQSASAAASQATSALKVTVTATAYVLPPGQTPLGGATLGAPATGATPAGSASGGSSPTSPAVIKAGP
ncbi:MAG TPA: type II secretion system protein GspM [Solirubrobacteraceae bacterium]|jgi:Tfp pilus assembly protein PilO|nr:type II secretion system protein GspM [Solirubrobacteraceae bacterium]